MAPDPLSSGQTIPLTRFLDDEGQSVSARDVLAEAGDRPTLFAFFKTTCPTCKLAWPYVEKLHRRYGKVGVRVVGVSQNDDVSTSRFYNEFGNATFARLFDREPAFEASNAFGVESVPFFVLAREDGRVDQAFQGWQRQAFEDMGKRIAELGSLPHARLIDINDPVPPWKAG